MKILIADDEYLECEALSKMLTSSIPDLEILPFAATGTELIEKAMACFPDIIVADIHMPRMNGLDALKKVREEMPDVKMVIVTAYGEFEYAKQALKLGSRDYILKPVQPEQFISAVKSVAEEIRSQKKDEQIRRENQRKSEAYEPLVAENFLSSLVLGDLRGENIRRLQDLLRHPYYGGMIFSMGLRTGSPDEEQMLFSAIKAAVDEINCGDTGFALERKGEVVLCVFPGEMEEDEEICRSHIGSLAYPWRRPKV